MENYSAKISSISAELKNRTLRAVETSSRVTVFDYTGVGDELLSLISDKVKC
ncbi:hypothetical protein ACYULU_07935 [Breznakiellaceae bacterium SP9]